MVQDASHHGFLHNSQYPTLLSFTTAAASLLCLLPITIDTLRGFWKKKLWFPCKYFPLNAATIAVLAIATIPPVFSNSPKPSCGELANLTSSILLCVSMGFFMPSLGGMGRGDLIFNLVAVTILAITMVVNICFRMGTGMKFTLFSENMIIIICILALLLILWFSSLGTGTRDVCDMMYLCVTNEFKPSSFEEMKSSLKESSKVAHVGNPQYILGRSSNCVLMSVLCGISVTVLLQEIHRSILYGNSSFCYEVSEYGFSTWVVISAQSIAIITAAVATTTRWLVIAWHVGPERFMTWRDVFRIEQYHQMWLRDLKNEQMLPSGNGFHLKILRGLKRFIIYLVVVAQIGTHITGKFMCYLSMWFTFMLKKLLDCLGLKFDGHLNIENSRWVYSISSYLGERDLNSWMLSNWERDIARWEKRYGRNIPTPLIQLLDKWPPHRMHHFHNLGSPHLVLVMRIALLLSSNEERNQFLLDAFNQGLELVLFVEENSGVQSIIFNSMISPTLWRNRNDPDNWLNKKFESSGTGLSSVNIMELGILLQMFRDYQARRNEANILNHLSEGMEMMLLVDLLTIAIFTGGFRDNELNVADFFEETASQILRSLLSELPHAIYNKYSRCPFEKCEEKLKRAMYFLSMAENLQGHIEFNWDNSDDEFMSSDSYTSSTSSEEWSFNPSSE